MVISVPVSIEVETARREKTLKFLTATRHLTCGLAKSCSRADSWQYTSLSGLLVEVVSGAGTTPMTAVLRLVLDAQLAGETTVWIGSRESLFFPPDAALLGVDLEALPIICPGSGIQRFRVADRLLRCGGVGLVVMDLCGNGDSTGGVGILPDSSWFRLAALARLHRSAVLFLSPVECPLSHPAVSLSVKASMSRCDGSEESSDVSYRVSISPLRNRIGNKRWFYVESYDGPDGMC